uniref:Uncharacterized protein n=1 Tax=Aegilops tauschii subsp. strangulata TaxID=200361 RepID=A0A453AS11_AEGTS
YNCNEHTVLENFICELHDDNLEKLINANSTEVDWERSFYLNLVAHTSYTVTVALCRSPMATGLKSS